MIDQLHELLEMQKALDESILKEHGNVYDEEIAEKMKVALFVELGELMNEFPTKFKNWKKTAKDDREKGLVEYVDALHFALSLFNHYQCNLFDLREYEQYHTNCNLSMLLIGCVDNCRYDDCLMYLFDIGNNLGFTWEEIYKAYKAKNQVNYERLANGY